MQPCQHFINGLKYFKEIDTFYRLKFTKFIYLSELLTENYNVKEEFNFVIEMRQNGIGFNYKGTYNLYFS